VLAHGLRGGNAVSARQCASNHAVKRKLAWKVEALNFLRKVRWPDHPCTIIHFSEQFVVCAEYAASVESVVSGFRGRGILLAIALSSLSNAVVSPASSAADMCLAASWSLFSQMYERTSMAIGAASIISFSSVASTSPSDPELMTVRRSGKHYMPLLKMESISAIIAGYPWPG
jgi:hypothetical protein